MINLVDGDRENNRDPELEYLGIFRPKGGKVEDRMTKGARRAKMAGTLTGPVSLRLSRSEREARSLAVRYREYDIIAQFPFLFCDINWGKTQITYRDICLTHTVNRITLHVGSSGIGRMNLLLRCIVLLRPTSTW